MTTSRVEVKVRCLEHFDREFSFPLYHTAGAAGADIRASLPATDRDRGIILHPGQKILVPTGLCLEIPPHFEIQVRPRSGLSFKTGLNLPNAPGTIDSDYRGELKILMGNVGDRLETIGHGDRVAQLIVAPVAQAVFFEAPPESPLSQTERREGGFGHTGRN